MKNIARPIVLAIAVVSLGTANAIAAPSKKQQDYDDWLLSNQPFDKVPAVLDMMESHGTMTPARHQRLLAEWKAKKPEWDRQQAANQAKDFAFRRKKERERARELASLTPAQRLDLEMRQKELDFRREQANAQQARLAQQRREQQRDLALQSISNTLTATGNQMRADQRRQEDFTRALILQQMRRQHPRTYDSTVTPTYPGGPVHVHTEQTGGY